MIYYYPDLKYRFDVILVISRLKILIHSFYFYIQNIQFEENNRYYLFDEKNYKIRKNHYIILYIKNKMNE